MAVSVIDPVTPAVEHTKLVLFAPFDLGKWLRLGFCAFLASLAQGGCNGGGSGGGPGGGGGGGPGQGDRGAPFDSALQWIRENAPLIAAIAFGIFVLVVAFTLLIVWLSSRGTFMFLDGVVQNRGAVVEPWREYGREGNSLFRFRIALFLIAAISLLLLAGICLILAWPSIQQRQMNVLGALALVLGILGIFLLIVTFSVVSMFVTDFAVPIIYLHRTNALSAWKTFYHELLRGNEGTFLLYVLFKIVLGIAVAAVGMVLFCATCCVAAIPYVGSVILLPVTVFVRSYSLYFLAQFGPKWNVFAVPGKPPVWGDPA